jgi:RNA polymerase primary sigma factor
MNDNSILDKYLNEIGGTTLLTDEEEQALALRIENGDEGAIGEIVSANLRYVVTIARQYERQGLSNEDLISEGNIGLMKAAARYSTRTGKRFVVFAAPFIRQAIELAIEKQTGLYRIPKGESTAAERKQSHALSFDEPIPVGSKNNFSLLNVVEDKDAVRADELTEKKGLSEELAQHIGILPEREQEVIKSVFGIGRSHLTMAETGAEMGLKRERVRQIRDKALRKLRKACITNQ